MKKVLLSIVLAVMAVGVHAQTASKAIMPKIGYQTEAERFLFGIEGRYFLTDNIRLAPGVSVLFPKNSTWGMDVDVNVHYVFPMQGGLAFYPFVGGVMMNNRWSDHGESDSWTDFGLNIGAGVQYDITNEGYLNFEFKYSIKEDKDPAYFTVGYGIRF